MNKCDAIPLSLITVTQTEIFLLAHVYIYKANAMCIEYAVALWDNDV